MWLILLLVLSILIAILVRRQYTHWEGKNIPYVKPTIPFGNLEPLRRKEKTLGSIIYDIYEQSRDKITGIYLFFQPALLVRDPELVHQIMTTEFGSFHDRGVSDIDKNLFALRGQDWKTLRAKLTPTFTTGKLKGMFGTVDDVAVNMIDYLNDLVPDNGTKVVEIKNVTTNYAIDVIGSVIFGLQLNSFEDPQNEFREVSRTVFEQRNFLAIVQALSVFICPQVDKLMHFLGYKDPTLTLLTGIVKRTVEYREQNNIMRRDLLQLLIQLRNTGKINEDDKNWNIETVAENLKSMSIDMIASQGFLFYIAGSETTASASAFTLYELAMYPTLLERAQAEVMECLERHGLKASDKLTYEALHDMKFLDLCLMETTRKYPGLPFLNRECTQDFEVSDINYTIKKGTPIIISLLGLHRDPEYFPNPMQYDPDRFLIEDYNPIAYMPFGEGPRHCIAQRMGQINSKLAIAKILSNFNIEPMERKEVEFIFDSSPALIAKDGLNIKLSKKKISN